jgi:5-methylcytosine-specific restriction protein A
MPAYLLTWNPKESSSPDLADLFGIIDRGQVPGSIRWSCGRTRAIPLGSRIFFLRQAVEPKGIVASGWVTRSPFERPHWNEELAAKGKRALYVQFVPDAVLDPASDPPFDVRPHADDILSGLPMNSQSSGVSISHPAASDLEELWSDHMRKHGVRLGAKIGLLQAFEGIPKESLVRHRSRETALRKAKLEHAKTLAPDGRLRCETPGCAFDFEEVYGELGAGFAQVHHRKPLSEAGDGTLTHLDDLAVVCANCHAMVHLGGGSRPLESLIPGNRG